MEGQPGQGRRLILTGRGALRSSLCRTFRGVSSHLHLHFRGCRAHGACVRLDRRVNRCYYGKRWQGKRWLVLGMSEPTMQPVAESQAADGRLEDSRGHTRKGTLLWVRVAALAAFIIITASAFFVQQWTPYLERLGYMGAFLAGLVSSATVILPAPGLAVVFALGGSMPSPLLLGLAAGTGMTLGELTGYLAGYSGRGIVEERSRYQWMVAQTQRYGGFFIFLIALIPNPAFDLAGIGAGTLRFPVSRFLLASWPGKTIKAVLVAYAGAGLIPNLADWISRM